MSQADGGGQQPLRVGNESPARPVASGRAKVAPEPLCSPPRSSVHEGGVADPAPDRQVASALAVPESLDPPAIGRLREVQFPTRVIIGLEDLPAIQALSEYLATSIPRATLSRLPHTGHLPPLERPAEVSDAIRSLVSASA
jgi:pimeloyl-ACP methyl ester carboxylesterase